MVYADCCCHEIRELTGAASNNAVMRLFADTRTRTSDAIADVCSFDISTKSSKHGPVALSEMEI